MSDKFLEGYDFYKNVQGTKYDKNDVKTKNTLRKFRDELGKFTDRIFHANGLIDVPNGKGKWQNSGNYLKYMWNRYKLKRDASNLVIYFNASTIKDDGLFISIGLIDDKLNEFEKKHHKEIYDFLESECSNIECNDFNRHNTGWGDRVFTIIDEENYKDIDYACLLDKLKKVYERTINQFYKVPAIGKTDANQLNEDNGNMLKNNHLNQILYGPPGTGKTYKTVNKALEIIFSAEGMDDNREYEITENREEDKKQISYKKAKEKKDRAALKSIFDYFREKGQIEFVTFHQSYGYEEFVEGIKPCELDSCNSNSDISYTVKDGIFKFLSNKAIFSQISSTVATIESLNFDDVYDDLLKKIREEKILELNQKNNGKIINLEVTKQKNISFTHQNSIKSYTASKDRLKKLYDAYSSDEAFKNISNINDTFRNIIGGCNSSGYWAVLNYILQNIGQVRQQEDYEIDEYDTDYEKVKNTVNNFLKTERSKRDFVVQKNYVLIIDEINRGNISKIFGELITLVEDSKRVNDIEEIVVKLPYSGDLFSIPENLFIIGTMNTADRSIAPIDTALRRRFIFEELPPIPEKLSKDIEGINLQEMLEAINVRIEYLYDRDHTIGHSYFLNVKKISDLRFVMKNQIIPLLAEYFYEDWANINLVLNDNGFIVEKKTLDKYLPKVKNIIRDKIIYEVSDEKDWSGEHFKRIYGNINNLTKETEGSLQGKTDEQESTDSTQK